MIVRELTPADLATVDSALPLHRLDPAADGTYLLAWDEAVPVGHVYVAWEDTELGVPELQDLYVLPERRGEGVGTSLVAAAEQAVAARGHGRSSLSTSDENTGARRLFERLGYERAGVPPKRVRGTITLRGEPFEVDDTLLYFVKAVDFAAPGSS